MEDSNAFAKDKSIQPSTRNSIQVNFFNKTYASKGKKLFPIYQDTTAKKSKFQLIFMCD